MAKPATGILKRSRLLSPHEAAYALGSSSWAPSSRLPARHPERLRRAVAHGPPLVELPDDAAPHRALFAEVRETFKEFAKQLLAALARP